MIDHDLGIPVSGHVLDPDGYSIEAVCHAPEACA